MTRTTRIPSRRPAWGAWACGALVALALAGPAEAQSGARQRYLQERERCMTGQSHQERRTCLREAAAAYEAARRGELGRGLTPDDFQANALARCRALPTGEQDACRARIEGQGVVRGSVEEGGIYREYRQTVPVPAPAGGGPESARPAGDAPPPVPSPRPADLPAGEGPDANPTSPQTDPHLQFSGRPVPGQIGPSTAPGASGGAPMPGR